jgi:2-keto-4-pentenoate hydratase/2-oxohepta-3-ene-1,7-dioic acid hydratase in catechol pathway
MPSWIAYQHAGQAGFGTLEGAQIAEHQGDLFDHPTPTGRTLPLTEVQVAVPCRPPKFLALWNNDRPAAAKQGLAIPAEPLYFLKAPSCYRAHGQPIEPPTSDQGRVVYEGELGLVIGAVCKDLSVEQAARAIFGVTCVNDVTAIDLLHRDPAFPQWTRAKSFDTFGVFGPVIATGLDPAALRVRTLVNGRERQSFACAELIFSPAQLVSALSHDLTLVPGDLIACGTSLGVLPMRPGMVVEVVIEGVGTLRNTYGPAASAGREP